MSTSGGDAMKTSIIYVRGASLKKNYIEDFLSTQRINQSLT